MSYGDLDSGKDSRNAKMAAGSTKTSKYMNLPVASIILHGGLVLLHVALFVVYSHHYEHRITASWNTWLPAATTIISQTFGTIYLAILVFVTQRLSLVRDLCSLQTLTAIHDKNNAWLGIASAVTTVFQQRLTPAAPLDVMMIATYLGNIVVLHITVPALFHFIPTNRTIQTGYPTSLSDAVYDFDVYSAWDVLPVYDEMPTTLGLLDNMVYDVIPALPSTVGTTKVNASLYTVNCAPASSTLKNQSLIADKSNQTYTYQMDDYVSITLSAGTFNYRTMLTQPQNDSFSIKFPNPNYRGPTDGGFNSSDFWSPFLISSTVPFVSRTGEQLNDNWIPLNPAIGFEVPTAKNDSAEDGSSSGSIDMAYIPAIQLVTCALNLTYALVDVDSSTRMPVSTPESPSSTETTPWWYFANPYPTPSNARFVSAIGAVENAPADSERTFPQLNQAWALLWNASRPASVPTLYPPDNSSMDSFHGIDFQIIGGQDLPTSATVLDAFLGREVGLLDTRPTENISIKDLEAAFGKALAARYWYGRNLNYSDPHQTFIDPLATPQDENKGFTITSGNGTAIINQIVLQGELDLNLIPLIAGTVSSVALFFLSIYFIRVPKDAEETKDPKSELKGVGILQLAWLLGNEPELAAVGEPEIETLRAAGMFYLTLSERAHEKMKLGNESGELKDTDPSYVA